MKIINNKEEIRKNSSRKDVIELFPKKIIEVMELCKVDINETIIEQDEQLDYLYYVLEGKVIVHTYLENGKNIILANNVAPFLLGEIELLDNISATMSVKALSPLILFRLNLDDYKQVLLNDNHFLRKLCSLLASKEAKSVKMLIYNSGFGLKNRLAAFILDNSIDGVLRIRKVELAGTFGVSYRHLSLVLSKFVKDGLLRKEKFNYHIINEKKLRKMATVIDR